MNLSELHALVDGLREERDALHNELHALLADDSVPAGELRKKEAALRAKIREINEKCYPYEVVRGKTVRLLKGEKLSAEERESFDKCKAAIGEDVVIG